MRVEIEEKIARFPRGPGVYLFLGVGGQTLYVGKAANLKARLRSYLKPGGDGRQGVLFLEKEAVDVEFMVTATEQEALLLENTIIKKRKPRYNVQLRDDKAFLLLRLDLGEEWPWFQLVRRRKDDGARYFGPYASATSVRRTLRLLHKVVPLRDCTDTVFNNRSRPCIKNQIGRCPAPCVLLVDRAEYGRQLDRAMEILGGSATSLLKELRDRMQGAAGQLAFEQAHVLKMQIEALSLVTEKQSVVGNQGLDRDVLGVHRAGDDVTAVFLSFRDGLLEASRRYGFCSELPDDLLLADLLGRYYEGDTYVPRDILVPGMVAEQAVVEGWLKSKRQGAVDLRWPRRGAKRRHLDIAIENARLSDAALADEASRHRAGVSAIKEMVGLPSDPRRIHTMDVSTISGTSTVASRVCFVDGSPCKAGYRKYKIREAAGGDDFASMAEAVRRSLTRCLTEDDDELPDLLVVDGGKGQLGVAAGVLEDMGLIADVGLCALAKSRLKGVGDARRTTPERVFLRDGKAAISLGVNRPETLLLTRMRDEAHRFAITYHRRVRGKLGSELDAIPGVGPSRRRTLLRHFGSLTAVRQASREDLAAVPGLPSSVAERVFDACRRQGD